MLPVAEAQARLLALAAPLPVERVPVVDAVGRWVAEHIVAQRDQPSSDLSAMDGYAVRHAEQPGPWTVIGESAAGAGLAMPLARFETARIFTGAPIPSGADSVLIQEEAAREGNRLLMTGEGLGRIGDNVRPRGSDFAAGEPLVAAGTRITARHIALVASGGHGSIVSRRLPRIALISTGNELVPVGEPTPGASLPASNAPMLRALIGSSAVVDDLGIVRDDVDTIAAAFRKAVASADVIVTIGGASVGDHDLVRPALMKAEARLDFWRIAMRPGKPLLAGMLGDAIVLGLPGNPVSSYVTALLFLMPLVAHLSGAIESYPAAKSVILGSPLPLNGSRQDYMRARLGEDGRVLVFDEQNSAGLATLAAADGLIVRPPHAPPAAIGDSAEMLDLR